jgi:carboxymethylenebutenolidase
MLRLTRAEGPKPEDFHLSRRALAHRALGGMIFAGYAAAALAAEAAPIVTDSEGLETATVAIPEGGEQLPAYIARPKAPGRHPAVLVCSEVFGVHAYIQDICRRLAKQGYVAVAPAFFFRAPDGDKLPTLTDFPSIIRIVNTAHLEQVMGDVGATLKWLQAQPFVDPHKLAATGFCWGGGTTWMAASRFPELKAAVAWYGPLAHPPEGHGEPGRPYPVDVAGQLKCPVLGLYGAQDKGITAEHVAAMREALAKAGVKDEIVVYPDAGHGFHADYRDSYNARDAEDGWQRMLAFFRANGVA